MLKLFNNTESFNKQIKNVISQSVVECRFPQSSEITEIICAEPQVSLISCESASGRVNYSGKLILSIVYSDEEGKLCRMQKGVEFSHFADGEEFAPAQNCVCRLKCEKLNVRRDGSAFVASAVITAEIGVYSRTERNFIPSAEGAYLKTEKVCLCSEICFSGESEVEDDFDADSVADVLIPSAKAVVLSAVCGTGDVTLSGEIYLSLFAMRQQSPVSLERTIPFKCTIPCDDATAGVKAEAVAEVSDLRVTANVNEDRGKCDVNVVCNLTVNGWFVDERIEEVAIDAFSDTNELISNTVKESTRRCEDVKIYSERVSGLATTKDRLGYDCSFCAVALPKAECEYNPLTGCAEGVVECVLAYMQNGEIKSCGVSLPFSAPLNGVADEGQEVALDVAVSQVAVRLRAEGEAEAEASVKICATVTSLRTAEYLNSLEEGEETCEEDCAVSVFLPNAGDGLWEIAKKLKKSPLDVASCNPELQFPLTGKERIIVYRQKTV
ncbi:MAG: DUF3794 domain-containing protein [Candidatus Coproplasma sp.]